MAQQAIRNLSDLKGWLLRHNIDFSAWGSGSSKSINDLYREIKEGDTRLVTSRRIVDVAVVLIKSGERFLIQTKQEFADKRVRQRSWPPSEKLQLGETPAEAAKRCLFEELRLRHDQIESVNQRVEPFVEKKSSLSYPGLQTEYHVHIFEAIVSGLPQMEFTTKEEPSSTDDTVKWHTWNWGVLPCIIQKALV